MPKIEKEIIIKSEKGLHIRVASEFVRIASQFKSDVNILKDDRTINGKSIMSLLTLEGTYNSKIILQVDGDDAQEAIDKLENIINEEGLT